MAGYYYDRREDETPTVVADSAFAALVQLFIPFLYNEPIRNYKKSLYFFIDRELFAYTDIIKLRFCGMDGADLSGIDPSAAMVYRFAAAYFLHCMVNRKLSSCESDLHELAGSNPDTFLLDELFKAANECCNNHTVQEWLEGTRFCTKDGKYLKNTFLNVSKTIKKQVFETARTSRFTLRDPTGHYEYSWSGVRCRQDSVCIEFSINYPLEQYSRYEDMIKGLMENWGVRIFESFREEILEKYKKEMTDKEKEKLAVRGGSIDISDISFKMTESFFWKLLGLKRQNTLFSKRFGSDLNLMLYTLAVGETLRTYEQLRGLRNKAFGMDVDSEKDDETNALKKTLLKYLLLGPERYLRALERMKDFLREGIESERLMVRHDKVMIPNMPRMVMINIALDRYTGGMEDIRRQGGDRKDELICSFRRQFIETEVKKFQLITKKEIEMLLENDCSLGAEREDLIGLRDAM